MELTKGRTPFTFYDGPPFATGLPHYGHIAAGTIKDVMTRYATQTGHYCQRRFGWDCHGLPIEYEIDKTYKIKSSLEREQVSSSIFSQYLLFFNHFLTTSINYYLSIDWSERI